MIKNHQPTERAERTANTPTPPIRKKPEKKIKA
jgi:hypothetical protein